MKNNITTERNALARDAQEGLAGHGFGFVRHWNAVGGIVSCPLNEPLLDAPDDSPDVEQHYPADTASDADRKQAAALPTMVVQA